MEFPGEFYARNVTPFALKDWSDGEIYRASPAGSARMATPSSR